MNVRSIVLVVGAGASLLQTACKVSTPEEPEIDMPNPAWVHCVVDDGFKCRERALSSGEQPAAL